MHWNLLLLLPMTGNEGLAPVPFHCLASRVAWSSHHVHGHFGLLIRSRSIEETDRGGCISFETFEPNEDSRDNESPFLQKSFHIGVIGVPRENGQQTANKNINSVMKSSSDDEEVTHHRVKPHEIRGEVQRHRITDRIYFRMKEPRSEVKLSLTTAFPIEKEKRSIFFCTGVGRPAQRTDRHWNIEHALRTRPDLSSKGLTRYCMAWEQHIAACGM